MDSSSSANSPQSPQPTLLELGGITKTFPGVIANDSIDLVVQAGEIHALLGENGAGKSTLVKIIYAYYTADSGSMKWNGEDVKIASPAQAREMGIEMVFQHFSLFDAMTVRENIELVVPKTQGRTLSDRIRMLSKEYGLGLDPDRHVFTLSVGERQRVEIARCLIQSPKLLIMDEPTSVLTPQEADKLFEVLRRLAENGCAVLYISHKLEEIQALCHKATILRHGKFVAECDPAQENSRSMAEMMIGTSLTGAVKAASTFGDTVFSVTNLSHQESDERSISLKNINFEVCTNEIYGIAGVAGNGQTELMEFLSGERLADRADAIEIEGKQIGKLGIRARRKQGIAVVPEERLLQGMIGSMSLIENTFLGDHRVGNLSGNLWLNHANAKEHATRICKQYSVKHSGLHVDASSLSGGNLQKFLVGREILQQPRLLLASQPTWGIDAGSQQSIHSALLELAKSGTAVLIISPDLDELLLLCDRIAVMFEGQLSDPYDIGDLNAEKIGLLMGGSKIPQPDHSIHAD